MSYSNSAVISGADLFSHLESYGYSTSALPHLYEGKWFRLPAPGKVPANRDGWLRVTEDDRGIASASFGPHPGATEGKWKRSGDYAAPSAASILMREHKRQAQAKQQAGKRDNGAKKARDTWARCVRVTSHPYLERKGAKVYGELREDRQGRLVIPMLDAETGELATLQFICDPARIVDDKPKAFMLGGSTARSHYIIPGALPQIFVEGFATGATVHEATGRQVVVCFSAGALVAVAECLAQPGDCVGADNDTVKGDGLGSGTGHKAAAKTGLPFYMPLQSGKDWNDVGIEETRAAFACAPVSALPMVDEADLILRDLADENVKEDGCIIPEAFDITGMTAIEVAQHALGLGFLLAKSIPLPLSIGTIRKSFDAWNVLHPATLDNIMAKVAKRTEFIRGKAMSPVDVSPEPRKRHVVRRVDTLEQWSATADRSVTIIKAPMGRGKTQIVGRSFCDAARADGAKPVALCHRVSLVQELCARLGLESYEVVGAAADGAYDPSISGLGVCLPSISKPTLRNLTEAPQYLFIDEVSQVLRTFRERDLFKHADGDAAGVCAYLVDMIRNANHVVVCDAGIDDRTVEFLEYCRPGEKFTLVEVANASTSIEATIYRGQNSDQNIIAGVLRELHDGGRVWIASEGADRTEILGKLFADEGFAAIAINGKNKECAAQAAFLADPENESRKYDVVIASPVISSGISIEHGDNPHFTLCAYIGGGHAVQASDAMQMLRRVRYVQNILVAILANNTRGYDVSQEAITAGWIEGSVLEGRAATSRYFDAMVAGIAAQEIKGKASFASNLLWQMAANRWTLIEGIVADDKAIEVADLWEKAKEEVNQEHCAALIAAPALTEDEVAQLQKANKLLPPDRAAIEAFRIRSYLMPGKQDPISAELVTRWDNGKIGARMSNYSLFKGNVPTYDDRNERLSVRGFHRARAHLYSIIFEGIDVEGVRWNDELATVVMERVINHRLSLAALRMVPPEFGTMKKAKDGSMHPFKMHTQPVRFVRQLLRSIGLDWKRHDTQYTTSDPHVGNTLIEGNGAGEGLKKVTRVYFHRITKDSVMTMEALVGAWNARRRLATIEREDAVAADEAMPLADDNTPNLDDVNSRLAECSYIDLEAPGY